MRLMASLSPSFIPQSALRGWLRPNGREFLGIIFQGVGGEKTTLKTCVLLHSRPLSLMEFDDVNISINIGRGLKKNSKAAVVFRWWIICFFWLKYFLFWLFHHIPQYIATSCFTSFAELTKTCFLLFFFVGLSLQSIGNQRSSSPFRTHSHREKNTTKKREKKKPTDKKTK